VETFEKNFDPRKNDDPPFEMSKYSDIFSEEAKEIIMVLGSKTGEKYLMGCFITGLKEKVMKTDY